MKTTQTVEVEVQVDLRKVDPDLLELELAERCTVTRLMACNRLLQYLEEPDLLGLAKDCRNDVIGIMTHLRATADRLECALEGTL